MVRRNGSVWRIVIALLTAVRYLITLGFRLHMLLTQPQYSWRDLWTIILCVHVEDERDTTDTEYKPHLKTSDSFDACSGPVLGGVGLCLESTDTKSSRPCFLLRTTCPPNRAYVRDLCQVTRSYLGASLPHSTAYENEAYISDSCWLVYEACYEGMQSVSTSGSEQIV